MSTLVQFETLGTLGIARLNRPEALNCLNLEMVCALRDGLRKFSRDPSIESVVLLGNGTRSFCAGGDVKAVAQSCTDGNLEIARQFFSSEYELDYLIYDFNKPFFAFAHGVTLGGGWGLFAGAEIRVAAPSLQLGMPEILIGFVPDVGSSHFLSQIPDRLGLFLALTASRIGAAEAVQFGLAHAILNLDALDKMLTGLSQFAWSGTLEEKIEQGRRYVRELSNLSPVGIPVPLIQASTLTEIERILAIEDPKQYWKSIQTLSSNPDPWLRTAANNSIKGSPTSIALIVEQFKRATTLSRLGCLRMEYHLALHCCSKPDFKEGVRALLIDKDQSPVWTPAKREEINFEQLRNYFAPTHGNLTI